jgi:hypothetical protein
MFLSLNRKVLAFPYPFRFIYFILALFTVEFSYGQSTHLYSEKINIAGLKGSLQFAYDTISAKKGKAQLIYARDLLTITCADSSFTHLFSERELAFVLAAQRDSLVNQLKKNKDKDSLPIETDLLPAMRQGIPAWYNQIQNKLIKKEETKTVVSNVKAFALENDSMKASFIPNCLLKIYKTINKDSIRYATTIPIKRTKISISDGFIYSFNFDIDTAGLPVELKNMFQAHQVYSIRFNLRQNLLSKGLLSNRDPLDLKKVNSIYKEKNSNSGYVFYIGDFIDYISPPNATGTIFTAKDTIINFDKCTANSFDTVKVREKSLYSIINLDVFGDLVGFFGTNEPNGLIQTELKVNFYGFRRPIFQNNPFRARFTFANKGELFFRFSKLDNKNRYLPVLTDTVPQALPLADTAIKYVHGYRLFEYQNIYAGLRMNVAEVEYRGGSLSFPFELSYLRTPMNDTAFSTINKNGQIDTFLSPVTYGKNSLMVIPGIKLNIKAASYMDIDLHSRLFLIHPLTKTIQLSKAEFDEFYGKPKLDKVTWPSLINLGATITINLSSDKSRRIIFRGENYIDSRQRGNNFWQAQIGYSADLNKFISLNNPAKTD